MLFSSPVFTVRITLVLLFFAVEAEDCVFVFAAVPVVPEFCVVWVVVVPPAVLPEEPAAVPVEGL